MAKFSICGLFEADKDIYSTGQVNAMMDIVDEYLGNFFYMKLLGGFCSDLEK